MALSNGHFTVFQSLNHSIRRFQYALPFEITHFRLNPEFLEVPKT